MAKVRTTLTIDEQVLRAVKVHAARTGKGDSEVIEEALRRELGFDLLERLWAKSDLGEEEALALAVEGQHKTAGASAECARSSTRTSQSPPCSRSRERPHRSFHAGSTASLSWLFPNSCSPSSSGRWPTRSFVRGSRWLKRTNSSRCSAAEPTSLQIPRSHHVAPRIPATTICSPSPKASARCSSPGIAICSIWPMTCRFVPRVDGSKNSVDEAPWLDGT